MMSVRFTGEDDESKAWNMNVANPDGKIFFVTRGGPDSMYQNRDGNRTVHSISS